MTRRDTLIIAALINVGLLVILFVTAMNSSEDAKAASQGGSPPITLPLEIAPSEGGPVPLAASPLSSDASSALDVLAPTAQEATPLESTMEITVRRGDQLERIAAAYGVSEEELLKLNGMTSNQLTVGQMLKVPLSGAGAALLATSPAADEASKGGKSSLAKKKAPAVEKKAKGSQEPVYYIVKKGDSPWTIAQKHKIKLEELLSLNNLDEKKARRLKEGDKLRVK